MHPGIEMSRLHREELMRAAERRRRHRLASDAERGRAGARARIGRVVIFLGVRIAGEQRRVAQT